MPETGEPDSAPLLRLALGFGGFKTMAAALDLGLFQLLAERPDQTREEIAVELELAERPADVLLSTCVSLELLLKNGELYRCSDIAAEFLTAGKPRYSGGLIRFFDRRSYPEWQHVGTALRENRPTTMDTEHRNGRRTVEDEQRIALFWEAMRAMSGSVGRVLTELVDLAEHHKVLDLGGGSGSCAIELCRGHPQLSATVFELPHICPVAANQIRAAGLTGTIDTLSGDFHADPGLPTGYDVMLLSNILHDWDEGRDRELLRKCLAVLPSGGLVIISEMLLNPERTGPPEAMLLSMQRLIETEQGRNYSESEYAEWLADTGFTDIEVIRFTALGANGAVLGRVP
ncbi:methyltransferase [Sciscionella sediminilitoris]|uniref:methyltransferase n=1 Tax=Sciscionella sediminilitoris TaxID=1445613 RepID=UPI0004DFCAEF|nr:methyltransferase [Sciscionella sp. SE31]